MSWFSVQGIVLNICDEVHYACIYFIYLRLSLKALLNSTSYTCEDFEMLCFTSRLLTRYTEPKISSDFTKAY